MSIAILAFMGVLGAGALAAWLLAIRLSYRIERLRSAERPRPVMVMTNIIDSAIGRSTDDPAVAPLQKAMRLRLLIAVACILVSGIASFALAAVQTAPS
ncbi:MAG: hypothetical protein R3C52_01420 [Hyphomonadaceae bacterium]